MKRIGSIVRGRRTRGSGTGKRASCPIEARTHYVRLRALGVGFAVLSAAYCARLVQLQAIEGGQWRVLARAQSAEEVEIPAPRGRLLDRDGEPLALDDTRYRAFVAPRELDMARRDAIEAIDRVIGLDGAQSARLSRAESGWVPVGGRVTDEERSRLLASVRSGLHFEPLPARTYPLGRVARPLIGAIDTEGHGKTGLELELEPVLTGRPGASWTRRDAAGRTYWLPDGRVSEPRPGHDVVLTIDADLQRIAENELQRALAETGSAAGDILILDPRTGELLAVASRTHGGGAERIPAFTDAYEPGSTLKPFLLATLLAEEAVDLDEVVDVEGGTLAAGRRVIRDVHPNDELSVAEVFTFSSNVGASKLASRVRPAVQYRYLRDFGFGMPTGIEHPAESGGRLGRPDDWTALSPASLAMGYEISVTSLQLAAAYGALANGGVLMQPLLVKEVRDGSGRVARRAEPRPIRRVLPEEVAGRVTDVLRTVVREGTGTLAAMASLEVAGKTGTARLAVGGRYAPGRYRASFVGYAPAEDPRLVILTRLEDPQGSYYGGAIAAPTSHATLEAALATQGVRLDQRLVVRTPQPRRWSPATRDAEPGPFIFAVGSEPEPWPAGEGRGPSGLVLPDLTGLPVRAAVARLHELGLKVELRGHERVRGQEPAPGRELAPGTTVVLR